MFRHDHATPRLLSPFVAYKMLILRLMPRHYAAATRQELSSVIVSAKTDENESIDTIRALDIDSISITSLLMIWIGDERAVPLYARS